MTRLTLDKIKDMLGAHNDGVDRLEARDNLGDIIGWLLERVEAARLEAIEEVASQYHGALADFFDQKGYEEYANRLPGFAEKDHRQAAVHRTYAKEIRAQVWLEDAKATNETRDKHRARLRSKP